MKTFFGLLVVVAGVTVFILSGYFCGKDDTPSPPKFKSRYTPPPKSNPCKLEPPVYAVPVPVPTEPVKPVVKPRPVVRYVERIIVVPQVVREYRTTERIIYIPAERSEYRQVRQVNNPCDPMSKCEGGRI